MSDLLLELDWAPKQQLTTTGGVRRRTRKSWPRSWMNPLKSSLDYGAAKLSSTRENITPSRRRPCFCQALSRSRGFQSGRQDIAPQGPVQASSQVGRCNPAEVSRQTTVSN